MDARGFSCAKPVVLPGKNLEVAERALAVVDNPVFMNSIESQGCEVNIEETMLSAGHLVTV